MHLLMQHMHLKEIHQQHFQFKNHHISTKHYRKEVFGTESTIACDREIERKNTNLFKKLINYKTKVHKTIIILYYIKL